MQDKSYIIPGYFLLISGSKQNESDVAKQFSIVSNKLCTENIYLVNQVVVGIISQTEGIWFVTF